MQAYEELKQLHRKLHNLRHLLALGEWDMHTMMPPKGATARANALAELEAHVHQLHTAPRVALLLKEALLVKDELAEVDRANLREMVRLHELASQLPEELLRRRTRLTTLAQQLWVKCRAENDIAAWLPTLQELVDLEREEGRLRAGTSGKSPYDALLGANEPGMTVAKLDAIYADIKSWLPALYKEVLENRKDMGASLTELQTPISKEKQIALGRQLMTDVWKYDWGAGRYDEAPHPFGGMVKEDVRMTYYWSPDNYTKCLLATIHETGHAKYEQNCGPRELLGQPVCEARSGGIHETQSLLAERMIAKSAAFAEYLTPLLELHLGAQPGLTVENVRKINQLVKPSYIRTLADEVGYSLHVILRYEIERDLIEGRLEAVDVPRVWDEKMKEYMGLETLGRDDLGCLQDIHWAAGYWGSFPAYTIGAIGAAQLMAAIRQQLGDDVVTQCIRTGHIDPILAKQKEMIWDLGCLLETDELLIKATGEPLNPRHLREHLERRYLRNED
ncbi:carboxypeptidase [Leishmania donovani]|uniref:carboxypeptidase Taq n=1 Tax=Leishmania donovani TaxID=5661 RepID=A0A504XY26_LEIDO|nr:Carboxypeptidase Taq (M32) metallopeptidase family protein [Leishmania donovani]CAJ1987282.1 carboxypeptidase [Leishmania donovani]VDZ43171.1 carboxypeptidase_putative/GeneDB:LmjF.13.0090/GeneDB:LmjF.14.0180/GeneDB:LmjF.33.2540/GeneDB:LmjF.36.6260 [Leishmania donovani]